MSRSAEQLSPAVPSELERDDLRLLRFLRRAPLGLSELAELGGMARNTVVARVNRLVEHGLVVKAASRAAERGRPSARFRLNARLVQVLFVSFEETRIVASVSDIAGAMIARVCRAPDDSYDSEHSLGHVAACLDALAAHDGVERGRVRICVLGVQGPVSPAGKTMPWSRVGVLPENLAARLGMMALVENDANLMALGTTRPLGPDDSALCVLISNGIGTGVIANGQLVRGAGGWAGEVGHVPIAAAGDQPCVCGSRGCVSSVAGNSVLIDMIAAAGHDVSSVAELEQLAIAGNLDVIFALRKVGRHIGEAILGLVVGMAPARVLVGGQVARIGDHLLAGVRETILNRTPAALSGRIEILAAPDHEEAMRAGAVDLAFDHLFPDLS